MGIAISTFLGARATKESANLPRTKVKLSNDIWLDVLKFFSCTQWSEKRYVSHQISGIGQRNISRLPRVIIEMAMMDFSEHKLLRELSDEDNPIVAFGALIPKSEIAQWFVNRGITLKARIQFRPLFTRIQSASLNERAAFDEYFSDFADICILGRVQQSGTLQSWWFDQILGNQYESVLFYAQFIPNRKYSWPAMEQFLTFLFHPSSYSKVVEMYTVNQKFVDVVKNKLADNSPIPGNAIDTQTSNNNKPLYIHCKTFSLLFKSGMNVDGLFDTLTWLERNVRAESIRIPFVSMYTLSQDNDTVCRILNNFVFGALRICAKRELRIHSETDTNLLISLVKKFLTLPLIEREIPTIVLKSFPLHILKHINLGPNVVNRQVDSQGTEFLYVFENGHNRMRISFCEMTDSNLTYPWDKEYDCYVKFYAV